ncbi:MAG: DUF2939 domain-containing protein [Alphaproteobacteria bacterium]|nr:DUF2939 domain-containing protein [Alphaproteobacteria bacterium]
MFGKIGSLLFILVTLAGGAYVYGPYATTTSLTKALEAEDAAAVQKYVDFDAVKASFSDDFAKRLNLPVEKKSIGEMIVGEITAGFLRQLVSPDSMVLALKDAEHRKNMGLSSSVSDVVVHGNWIGLEKFVLNNPDGQPATLLEREGFGWKVTGLRVN